MENPISVDQATDSTPISASTFDSLYRWVEGLLDAGILLAEEGIAILNSIDLARRHHREGDLEATRRHRTRVVQAVEGLVRSGLLGEAHGRMALALTGPLLQEEAG
jgi:hypothetical protein